MRSGIRLSKRGVEAVGSRARDVFVWDSEVRGFGLKVTPKGRRIYILQYSRGNRDRRITIGHHGELTAEEARREAIALRGAIARGGDPDNSRPQRTLSLPF
jgi:hypothetical protein